MKFSEFPFLRYVLFFVVGVMSYPYMGQLSLEKIQISLLLVFLLYGGLKVYGHFRKNYQFKVVLPLLAYMQLVLAGLVFTGQRDAVRDRDHLVHQEGAEGYLATVLGMDEKKPRSYANTVQVSHVRNGGNFVPATGEVIVYHQLEAPLLPGEVVWISGFPEQLEPPKNPEEFDYRRFLAHQQIYHRHFIGKKVERLGRATHAPIDQWVMSLRDKLETKIEHYLSDGHANQIAKALLLGQKKDLDQEVSEAYVTAGTMHVLAVSGLHVGIIYGFFFLLFKPYQLSPAKRVLYLSIVILLIWLYALLTGMSPSVMRAATMFTLMGLAQMQSRSPSIFNALALSALILILFDPFIIFAVGFQLSYAALLGILLLQPVIRSLWLPKNKIVYYCWEITSVSIAAQLATFPISVYYFHVFPTYFLLSNLVAIPGAFLIMSLGLPFLILSSWTWAGKILGYLLNKLIGGVNHLIFAFREIPGARLEEIYLRPDQMVWIWCLLVVAYGLITTQRKWYAYLLTGLLILGVGLQWGHWWNKRQDRELYVYALPRGLALTFGNRGSWWQYRSQVEAQHVSYQVLPHQRKLLGEKGNILKGKGSPQSETVYLPEGSKLEWKEGLLHLPPDKVKAISFWEEGEWKAASAHEQLKVGDRAYRIIFQ